MKFIANIDARNFDLYGNMIFSVKLTDKHAMELIKGLNAEAPYIIEVKDASKRNLRQNGYLWALIREISKALMQKDDDTYLTLLKQAQAKYDYIGCVPEAVNNLKQVYRIVELVEERDKMNVYRCYYGSSKMTKKEFNELLEYAISWCYELDIDPEVYRL